MEKKDIETFNLNESIIGYSKKASQEPKLPKIRVIFTTLCVSIIIFLLYLVSNNPPEIKSYNKSEIDNSLLVHNISDEMFLNKVKTGTLQEIQQLLQLGANIKALDAQGRNALSLAAMFNPKADIAKVLARYKVDINHIDNNGYSPLMLSTISGSNQDFIKELLRNKANPNQLTPTGISALMVAVGSSNDEKIIEDILKYGVKVNYKNKDKVTALMVAAKITTNPKIIDILLKYGANPKDIDSLGISVYEIALSNPRLKDNKPLLYKLR